MSTISSKFRLALAILFSSTLATASEKPAIIDFARPLGMGGAFTAVADDSNIFNYNPAGMVQRTGGQFTLLEVAGGVSQGFRDAAKFVKDNEKDLNNYSKLSFARQQELYNKIKTDVGNLDPRAYVAADVASYVSGPHFLGMPIHAGYGAFGAVDASFKLEASQIIPSVTYSVNNDLIFPLAIAKRWESPFGIPGKLGFGLTGKFMRRNQVHQDRLSLGAIEDIKSPPIVMGRGFGGDAGLLYQPTNRWNLGMMIRDVGGTRLHFDATKADKGFEGTPERDSVIKPQTNLGVALIPEKLLWLIPSGERWTFAADVQDVLKKDEAIFFERGLKKPFGENLYTHVHLGAEFRYWFLRFRGGASQGYPTLGLGLDIPFLKIDFAYYSRELGVLAGDRREKNYMGSIAMRFGSGGTESRERIKKAKEDRKQNKMAAPEVDENSTPAEKPAESKPKDEKKSEDKSKASTQTENKQEVAPAESVPQ